MLSTNEMEYSIAVPLLAAQSYEVISSLPERVAYKIADDIAQKFVEKHGAKIIKAMKIPQIAKKSAALVNERVILSLWKLGADGGQHKIRQIVREELEKLLEEQNER